MKLQKYNKNPILSPNPANEWENFCVLNPAVVYDEAKREFVMLYRAAGDTEMHHIYLGLAKSKDGFHFERQSDKPVFSPSADGPDAGGVEDPRLVKMGDWYYMTYASRPYAPGRYWSGEAMKKRYWINPPADGPAYLKGNLTLTHLAITQDFISYKRLGRITDTRDDDRDVILFPERINGKFVRLSRPIRFGEGYPCAKPSTWIAYSDDLMEWSDPKVLMQGETEWESLKIGGSCPPLRTGKGWLHIYHGVAEKEKGRGYRAGAVLLDLNNPERIIARTRTPILEPEEECETTGIYSGCVFPTGNVIVDGTLYVYYGAADKYVCVATVELAAFLDYLIRDCSL
jgi:predicted GH43/DUF377 family glycosyl hydrolase